MTELPQDGPQRLHPMSWLFVLLVNLKEFALPLLAALFFGRGGNEMWEYLGMIGALVLAGISFVQYLSYRYSVLGTELVIREGIFSRNVRHVPLARIQNVSLHRNPLHRLFGVAEVQLESAAGVTPEAKMRVLSMQRAAELEQLVREVRLRAQHGDALLSETSHADAEEVLVTLPSAEILRLGLISNRGMVVVAGAIGVLSQLRPDGFSRSIANLGERLFGQMATLGLAPLQWVLGGILLVIGFVIVLRVFSVLLAFLQFHGFRLGQAEDRLRVESGLLTRVRASALRRRIQHWTVDESLLHRLFKRQSLKVETAVVQAANQAERGLSHLVPIGAPAQIEAMLTRLLPQAGWPALEWRPLHPKAWRRMFRPAVVVLLLVCAALSLGKPGAWAWIGLLLLPLALASALGRGRFGGYAVSEKILAFRSGWLSRQWSMVELHRLQGVQLTRSLFDQRNGMANVVVDTAGANPFGHRIHIRYLPEHEARVLYLQLRRSIEPTPARTTASAAPAQ
jgi:putative membrane protein